MLDQSLYPMIFKRKSFHLFRNIGKNKISQEEIEAIYEIYAKLNPLYPNIKTAIKIVDSTQTTCKRGQEYCILMYSEKKDNYLQNIGYLGQQLDLYLVSRNIGTLWFGIGKPTLDTYDGLDFVIMIAISKVNDETKFRKDMFKSKRKPLDEIWQGDFINGVSNIVRFAPSACNSQPWIVESHNKTLKVYRYKKQGKRGIMPMAMVTYYNRIDIGIFLCILELCLEHEGMTYDCARFLDSDEEIQKNLVAIYHLKRS